MQRRGLAPRAAAAALLGATLVGTSVAQPAGPGDHSAHHPGQPPAGTMAPANPGSNVTPAPSVQPGAGCGGMMGCMGGGPRPFYASLLDMPALTPEARRFIDVEAERRIGWGSQAIFTSQARLQHALAANNPAALQQATAGLREGLLRLESGTAALRAVESGTPPRQLALAWFRDQLGLPAAAMAMDGDGPWGLSWFHLTTMGFLVAFLGGTLLIQHARMRRVNALVQRLMASSPGAAPAPGALAGRSPQATSRAGPDRG